MEHRVVSFPQMILVGYAAHGKSAADIPIGDLWSNFEQRASRIENAVESTGYELHIEEVSGKHFCLLGVEVTEIGTVPVDMFMKVLPPTRYIMFTHSFRDGGFGEAYRMINRILEESLYDWDTTYDIQRYDERFKGPGDKDSVIEILVPLKE